MSAKRVNRPSHQNVIARNDVDVSHHALGRTDVSEKQSRE